MPTFDDMKEDLARLRDEAKLQVRLGTMEAQEEWNDLETKWNQFVAESRLRESADGIRTAFENLGQELRSAYERLAKAL